MSSKYYKAYKLDEALMKLKENPENSNLIAGGTDIVIEIKNKKIKPDFIIDISDLKELKDISIEEDNIELGSMVTFTQLENEDFPKNLKALSEAAHSVGSPQIRNKGTIGGNICNGSPAADLVPPLLALNSIVTLESTRGKREIALEDVFLDKGKTVLEIDEILTKIRFKNLKENEFLSFSKLGLRNALAISRICTSVYVKVQDKKIENIRIANGALGRYGIREKNIEDKLIGMPLNKKTIEYGKEEINKEIKERLKGRSSMEFKSEAIKGTLHKSLFNALNYFLDRKVGVING
ncbi:MAG: FAD binding domain-containing protein [Andreesenia angusta]|nr:FAD binding domain-containing protein [Andreesenia angusta]